MSKFQIVKGITDDLEETPYIEGKVYFVYDNEESQNITIYADIDGVRRKIKEGVQRTELDNFLLKTDIADWAKGTNKPTYTANEVGALPNTYIAPVTSVNGQTGIVNLTIPDAQIQSDWNATSGMAVILNKPTIPTVPTNISSFTNDSGYLTLADLPIYDGTVV